MPENDTTGLIALSVLGTGAISTIANLHNHKGVKIQTWMGAAFSGIFLYGIAMLSEPLARNFAVLLLLTALLIHGASTLEYLSLKGKAK